jgi:hypothetical protein
MTKYSRAICRSIAATQFLDADAQHKVLNLDFDAVKQTSMLHKIELCKAIDVVSSSKNNHFN